MNEDLRQWFNPKHPKGGWKRIDSKGNVVGPCAREPGEPKPKCMSNEKRAMLSKQERAAAVRAKRKHDPDPSRKGDPIMVSNFGKGKISEENEAVNKELWAKIQDLTAGRISSMEHNGETITGPNDGKGFDVHPSAYSNGWASKLYKRLGGTWRTKNESLQFSDFIQIDEVSPPDYKLTKFTHRPDIRADFRKRYGDDWQAVLYGKAWKNFKLKKKRGEVRKPSAKQKAKLVSLKAQDVAEAAEAKPYKGYNPEKNHPEGGLNPSYAKKLGIHAGVETKRAAERAGGFGKLKGKVAKRRDSFCSRMCGMKRENTSAEVAADPKSKINASLRVWGCNC
jgi:hypothetical protein